MSKSRSADSSAPAAGCAAPDPHAIGRPLKLIGRAHRAFTRVADQELREHGFAMGQLPVLLALKDGQPRSQAELARFAQVEQPSMTQLLNRMERNGLVERVPDPADKRSRLILLTDACRVRMAGMREVIEGLSAEALTGFSEDEVTQLAGLVNRLADNIDRMLAQRLG